MPRKSAGTRSRARAKPEPKPDTATGPGGVPIQELEPSYDFLTSIEIWQGAPKTGKTSTAAALGPVADKLGIPGVDPFFMLFERGSGGVSIKGTSEKCSCGGKDSSCSECEGSGVKRKILTSIKDIDEWFNWVTTTDYNPIIIDTGDAMFQVVADDVCVQLGISNPTQSDHGIAWSFIFDEMREKLAVLTGAGKGVIIIMHVYYQEKRLRGGATIQSASFNVSGKTRPYLAGLANQILHFEILPSGDGEKHVISTRPRAGIEAGDHWGVLPEEIERGESAEEGAEVFLKCWYEV